MPIGIFGGSFNPSHLGHLSVATAAIDSLGLDRLYLIPAGNPPHKSLPAGTPSNEGRLRLCQRMFAHLEPIRVLDIELLREEPSYTALTVEHLRRQHPSDEIFLLLGTDMFTSIETWYNAPYLFAQTTLVPFGRQDGDLEKIQLHQQKLEQTHGVRVIPIQHTPLPVSSTGLRNIASTDPDLFCRYVGDDVYGEILRNGYYDAQQSLPYLRRKSYVRTGTKRVAHIQGTEQTAAMLARRWGVSETLARQAAILHDITKQEDFDTHLHLAAKHGILLDDVEKISEKLLHAKTGAAMAKAEFSVCDQVFDAIFYHTTGRANMTMLEKMLYLADSCEPNRDFPGVDELRTCAMENLDKALLLALHIKREKAGQKGRTVHQNTADAIEWIEKNGT